MMDWTAFQQALWIFLQPVLLLLLGLRVVYSLISGLASVFRALGSWFKEHA